MHEHHPPTREEGLRRLARFVPKAGRDYAARRNYDLDGHPHVSGLSPYLRHRLLTEEEVLAAVLGRHSLTAAQKFVQEVFWRTYWKGWLEMRPGVWDAYRAGLTQGLDRLATEAGLEARWEAACTGDTGLAAFDHWARELAETGYLHNHARMWFASIWIFTLYLPWELGADFFLRHLVDGDAASNTLSWRWVAGLQTRGKHYLARGDNIARYTEGRFNPGFQLNTGALPLDGPPPPERRPLPVGGARTPGARTGLIVTEDDLSPGFIVAPEPAVATLLVSAVAGRSPLAAAPGVAAFTNGALSDCGTRNADRFGDVTGPLDVSEVPGMLGNWAAAHRLDEIVMARAPTGPVRDGIAPVLAQVTELVRPYDAASWPHATAGFFNFKNHIPGLIDRLGLSRAA